jgi:hypothetical protein
MPEIVIKAPAMVMQDSLEPFESPATGRWIESRRQMEQDLRESGCHLRERGEEKDVARARAEINAREEAFLDRAVRTTAQDLGL